MKIEIEIEDEDLALLKEQEAEMPDCWMQVLNLVHQVIDKAEEQKIILYTSLYRDGDSEYRELCYDFVGADKDLKEWAREQEETMGERDEDDGYVWDGDCRIYEVEDVRIISESDLETLQRLRAV